MKLKKLICLIISGIMILLTATFSASADTSTTLATKTKAIVIIPGIAGSKLQNISGQTVWFYLSTNRMNQLECTETGSSVKTISPETGDTGGVLDTYQDLYTKLNSAYKDSYDVFLFSYDWRMSCAAAATKLATQLQSYSEVILIGHSMGGLVASKYLATSSANRAKVDKFISLGTPYTGAAKALYMMETGEFIEFAGIAPFKDTIKSLVCNFPAVYELLPTSRYSGSYIKNGSTNLSGHTSHWDFMRNADREWGIKDNGSVKPMFSSALSFHSSLLVSGTHIANSTSVDTYKIYGTGNDTISKVLYTSSGTVIGVEYVNSGDGTVITNSATNAQGTGVSKIYGFECSHMGMPDTNSVINKIKAIINGTAQTSSLSINEIASQQINERGWIIGEDNKRINVMVYNGGEAELSTNSGYNIISEGNSLYYYNNENEKVHTGSVWYLGNNSYQYSLFDGDYIVEPNSTNDADVKIEYMDSGYYIKSLEFSDASDSVFTISDSSSKDVISTNSDGKNIVPTKALSCAELSVLNNDPSIS